MKKTLVALAVLGSFASAASAANSVTLYGRVDVGYESFSRDGKDISQSGDNQSRFGVKGQEDLGNGLAATFQLEGRFNADTGSYTKDMFDRESTIGLKGNFGHVRFGRSKSAMERGIGEFVVGERVSTIWDNYSSETRHSNSMFYDFEHDNFKAGFNVTTKGGALGDGSEGADSEKVAFGVYGAYNVGGFAMAAAFQQDRNGSGINDVQNDEEFGTDKAFNLGGNGTDLSFNSDREWGVAASYKFKPVTFGVSFAEARSDRNAVYSALESTDPEFDPSTGRQTMKTWTGYIAADITANDNLYVKYMEKRISGAVRDSAKMFGAGYSHALSKRTSVYADIARYKLADNSSSMGYSVAMRHAF
jgi:predicted porin